MDSSRNSSVDSFRVHLRNIGWIISRFFSNFFFEIFFRNSFGASSSIPSRISSAILSDISTETCRRNSYDFSEIFAGFILNSPIIFFLNISRDSSTDSDVNAFGLFLEDLSRNSWDYVSCFYSGTLPEYISRILSGISQEIISGIFQASPLFTLSQLLLDFF